MTLELGSICEGVAAQGAAEVVLVLLMAVLDVFLQRREALVASVTIRAGEQLGKSIWRSWEGKSTKGCGQSPRCPATRSDEGCTAIEGENVTVDTW